MNEYTEDRSQKPETFLSFLKEKLSINIEKLPRKAIEALSIKIKSIILGYVKEYIAKPA